MDHVLSANDLLSGRVVWWAGDRWSENFADARHGDENDLALVGAREEAADRVVGAAPVPLDAQGRPSGLRERRRCLGPSIALPGAQTTANGG